MLDQLGSEHRQLAAMFLTTFVEGLEYIDQNLDDRTKGKIIGQVVWEIAQTAAEILLTAGAAKLATGPATLLKFKNIFAQFTNKADEAAGVVMKLLKWYGKVDDGLDLGKDVKKVAGKTPPLFTLKAFWSQSPGSRSAPWVKMQFLVRLRRRR